MLTRNEWSHRAKIGEEAERRGAVDPERQEVLQLGVSPWREGPTRQSQGAQERVDLALGEGTYKQGRSHHCDNCFPASFCQGFLSGKPRLLKRAKTRRVRSRPVGMINSVRL